MEDYFQNYINTLQLNGKGERTQESYARSVRMLVEHYNKSPNEITEKELESYFLHRRNVDKWKPNTMKIAYAGLKFYFQNVLEKDWKTLKIVKAPKEKTLPVVLSTDEVRLLLNCVQTPHNRTFLITVYSCGFRLEEGLSLEIKDIDSQRNSIHVHRGKGAKVVAIATALHVNTGKPSSGCKNSLNDNFQDITLCSHSLFLKSYEHLFELTKKTPTVGCLAVPLMRSKSYLWILSVWAATLGFWAYYTHGADNFIITLTSTTSCLVVYWIKTLAGNPRMRLSFCLFVHCQQFFAPNSVLQWTRL